MSKLMTGSGKFVPSVSNYAANAQEDIEVSETVMTKEIKEEEAIVIPEVPASPDARPVIIQYAEEYFGKYWFVTLALLVVLLFRGIRR